MIDELKTATDRLVRILDTAAQGYPCTLDARDASTAAAMLRSLHNLASETSAACGEWAEVSQRNYQRAKAAEEARAVMAALLREGADLLADEMGALKAGISIGEDEDGYILSEDPEDAHVVDTIDKIENWITRAGKAVFGVSAAPPGCRQADLASRAGHQGTPANEAAR